MSIISAALVFHVLIGLIGVMASYGLLMGLLRKKSKLGFLKITSLVAFLSYILSWTSGGYYYVVQYGSEVKPVIKAGVYPWAHAIFTESKEHIFLFVPVLAFITLLLIWVMGSKFQEESGLKKITMLITLLTVIIGIFITVSGMIISGAAG